MLLSSFNLLLLNQSLQGDSIDCNDVHSLNQSVQCQFVKNTSSCHIDEGLIDYTVFVYCSFQPHLVPLATTILFVWLIFLFIALAICADNFFCPSLVVIAKTLRMSDNIAGVTLLAFGNGAPDVFSAISAVQNMKNNDVGLVFGALLGAGVFLTTVTVGAVCMTGPFHVMERPFLRDIIFYLATVFFTFIVCFDGVITLPEASGYLAGYVAYVIIVIVGRLIYQYQNDQRARERLRDSVISENTRDSDSESDALLNPASRQIENYQTNIEVSPHGLGGVMISSGPDVLRSASYEFFSAISPIDVIDWRNGGLLRRIYAVFKAPALFVIKLTVPVVDYTTPRHNWNKHLSVLHCVTTLVFSVFAANSDYKMTCSADVPYSSRSNKTIFSGLPFSFVLFSVALFSLGGSGFLVCYLFLLVGCVLAVVVMFTSTREQPPVYHWVFAYAGFIAAVLWISKVANEIVNLLQAGGVVFRISTTILGLTFLAWGNSIPDMVSDIAVAKRGIPRAGLSACFGGPLFNTLLGIGIPFTYKIANEHKAVEFVFSSVQKVLFLGLGASLLSTLFIVPLFLRFRMNRFYGFYLFVLYSAFLVVSVLVGTQVIHWVNRYADCCYAFFSLALLYNSLELLKALFNATNDFANKEACRPTTQIMN